MNNIPSGLSILTQFVELANSNIDISNPKILEKIIMNYPSMKIYKKAHDGYVKKNNEDANLNSLLYMNLLLADCQNFIVANQSSFEKSHKFRSGAIGKISLRLIEITDENLALLRNGYATSVISNLRLMLESYAIAKYLMYSDDLESDRFQDFGIVQECKMYNTDPNLKLGNKNYPESFLEPKSDFAWISDKSIKVPIDFINLLKDEEIIKWYRFYCKYVHASPYSCGKVHQMNQDTLTNNNLYMPLTSKDIIIQNKFYLMLFMELIADNFIADETFKELFKSISKLVYNFRK
ncbi:MAG: hypothetical protein J6J00_11185 [Treponema sp.]|nr:hypothetical protein [Treponema sp.]